MKISEIIIKDFKRFSNLTIKNISKNAKIVIIVGPNGSGKSSLFDALLVWYKNHIDPYSGRDQLYYPKFYPKSEVNDFDYEKAVKIIFHDLDKPNKENVKGKLYFRSAYRNQADFTISSLEKQKDPTEKIKLENFIQNDVTVSENYQRLISLTLKAIYEQDNDNRLVKDIRTDLIGKIRKSLNSIFEDLNLSSIGDPLQNGSFYFEKGLSKNFHYKNLSGGEKAAFDIILDLTIKSSYFKGAIYCIDEPETHMHTKLQGALLHEVYNLIPEESQLWINTHSLGMLKKAKEIERMYPDTIAFMSFDNLDFDSPIIIEPAKIDKAIWEKFLEITLDDYSDIIAPRNVVLCEGAIKGRTNKSFDAQIFKRIFQSKYPEFDFFSIGSSSEVEDDDNIALHIVKQVLKNPNITRITDRDDKSDNEISELKQKGIKVLSKRHIESYLLDDEIITKLCIENGAESIIGEVLRAKASALDGSIQRKNAVDDIKSPSAEICQAIKRMLNLSKAGNTRDAFLRDTMCPLITADTNVFKQLEKDIFS